MANGRRLVTELREVPAQWDEAMTGLRSDSAARRLADGLLRHPVIDAPMARDSLGVKGNEQRHIDALVERGILEGTTDHKTRNRTWRVPDVLATLDTYARRGGPRG